jgi:hypothetical protein
MATTELLITTAQSVTRSTASRPSSVRAGTSTGSVPGADTRTGVLSRVDARTAKDLASFYRITMLPRVSPAAGFKHKTPVGLYTIWLSYGLPVVTEIGLDYTRSRCRKCEDPRARGIDPAP